MPYSNIDKPSKYFDITLFTGDNASGRTFTGLNFAPDMIWGKSRDTASLNHQIVDIVRGGTKFIFTNSTVVEDTASHGQITSWNSDGTTWADGTNGTYPRLYYNDNGQLGGAGSRVWWQWKANGTGVSNTAGTISSTVSANTTSGFSIVSYTGTGSNATVGHGLGVAPKMMIVKNRSATAHWQVYHTSTGNTASSQLSGTGAPDTASTYWNDTSPTSTLFSIGTGTPTNGSGNSIIAYCFAEVKGFSKFSSYTGNGSSDGVFTYCGFRPAFVLLKRTSDDNWCMLDNKRDTYNVMDKRLFPNLINAESTGVPNVVDFLSNGFKLRTSDSSFNFSGSTYIYMAFAENPFVSSKGIPTTAR